MARKPSAIALFFGFLMMAVGVLIALLSGSCTLWFSWHTLTSGDNSPILFILIVGLPFVAIGIGLVAAGWSLSRSRDTDPLSRRSNQEQP